MKGRRFTLADLNDRNAAEVIAQTKPKTLPPLAGTAPIRSPKAKAKPAATPPTLALAIWDASGLPPASTEYVFHHIRKWRFDFAWPDYRIALEVEGGVWTGGRHTRGSGFLADVEKYNEAAALGWRVVRCTPDTLEGGETLSLLQRMLLC